MDPIQGLILYRKKSKKTIKQLSIELGISIWSLYRWFDGTSSPSKMAVQKINEYLKEAL